MKSLIQSLPCVEFGSLNWCYEHDIVYQRDVSSPINYGIEYFQHYVNLSHTEMGKKLNEARISLVKKYCDSVLDIGVGSGIFINEFGEKAYGYDINPYAIDWLKNKDVYKNPYENNEKFKAYTFWDSLEHMSNPDLILNLIPCGSYVFVSMPVFDNVLKVKSSKHYKPNEHFYYFTIKSFVKYVCSLNFHFVEFNDLESRIGRESIGTFVFAAI